MQFSSPLLQDLPKKQILMETRETSLFIYLSVFLIVQFQTLSLNAPDYNG